ncbi:MAG TPA: ATP-binding protein [Micromonosporaceae bacterium]
MANRLVLVNGLPGAGKTTLATGLADALAATLISKDAIKDALSTAVDGATASALGAAAMEAAWTLIADIDGTVVFDSWWFKPRDMPYAEAGIRRAGRPHVVEVWCDVPQQVARQRYERRLGTEPHAGQVEAWPDWAARGEPLGIVPTLHVNTERPVDVGRVAHQVLDALNG